MKCFRFFILILILFCSATAKSQTNSDGQLWLDGEINYTYKQRYLFQNELSYQTLISGGSHWLSLNTTPGFEYSINPHFDLVSGVPLSYTLQQHKMSTFEVRAMLGTRIYFTPTLRPQLRLLIRAEERWSYDNSANSWDIGNRLRFRAEFLYPLNRKSYSENKMWYLISDAELFFSAGSDISERFANRARIRLGMGYRLTYKLRFEAIYACQISRNTINDRFTSQSNILRLRLKYYFK